MAGWEWLIFDVVAALESLVGLAPRIKWHRIPGRLQFKFQVIDQFI